MRFKKKKLVVFVILSLFVSIRLLLVLRLKSPPKWVYSVGYYQNKSYQVTYVRYECVKSEISGCGGWADRLKGIVSTYAWALLTGRKFIIRITDPCPLETFLAPNQIDWRHDPSLDDLIDTQSNIYMYCDFDYMRQLESIDLLNYTNAQLINVRSALMFVDSFAKNTKLHPRIRELGYEPDQFTFLRLFNVFYKRLFRLADRLEPEYQRFLQQAKPDKRTSLICVQIRVGSSEDFQFMNKLDVIRFFQFVNETILRNLKTNDSYKIYVTSDHEYVKEEAGVYFGSGNVVSYARSSFHIENKFRKKTYDDKVDLTPLDRLYLDFHTMSNCDWAVVSHSGFGILGALTRSQPEKNLFVYTADPAVLKNDYWRRDRLNFTKIKNFNDIYFL